MFDKMTAVATSPGPWTDEELAEAVRTEETIAGVLKRLGYRSTSNPRVRAAIDRLGLDLSHMRGLAWAHARPWSSGTTQDGTPRGRR